MGAQGTQARGQVVFVFQIFQHVSDFFKHGVPRLHVGGRRIGDLCHLMPHLLHLTDELIDSSFLQVLQGGLEHFKHAHVDNTKFLDNFWRKVKDS